MSNQPRQAILAGGDVPPGFLRPVQPVFRREKGYQIHRFLQDHPAPDPGGAHPGLVGDQPDPLAAQRGEILLLENVDAELDAGEGWGEGAECRKE